MSDSPPELERVSLTEAAQRLGIAYDTARKRIKAGTLQAEQEGRQWFVWLPAEPDVSGAASGRTPEGTTSDVPGGSGRASAHSGDDPDELVAQLRDEINFLRQQVERQNVMIAGLIQRVPPIHELPAGETVDHGRDEASIPEAEPAQPAYAPPESPWRRFWRTLTGT